MSTEVQIRQILLNEFLKAQAKNPQFSMRAYSKKVGVTQSAISEILSGKRKITAKMGIKILSGLGTAPDELESIISKLSDKSEKKSFKSLDMDTFHLISDWHYFAILSLLETKNAKSSPSWIAKRLGISETKTTEALSRLLRLELIQKEGKNFKATGIQYQVDPGIATPALKKAHRQNLELASDALESTTFEERDFTAITFCFDPDRMSEARSLIKEFRKKFSDLMEEKEKKEVFKLCVQLFPLTKKD
ncbi:MAG: TIGR02147 family protein [Bacteriovoracaceae bacterium]